MNQAHRREQRPHAFTLTELLVVIIIILILTSILIPTIGKVLNSARATKTSAFIAQLQGAIEAYHLDFRAYPGPFPNNMIDNANATAANIAPSFTSGFAAVAAGPSNAGYALTLPTVTKITAAENLTLGLLGGLRVTLAGTNTSLTYDPSQIGQGPMDLGVGPVNRHAPYLSVSLDSSTSFRKAAGLLTGHFVDDAGAADDTSIPEFVDGFTNPMPILYLRAKVGASVAATRTHSVNSIVTYNSAETDATAAASRPGQYDLHQIIGYTGTAIGVSKDLPEVSTAGDGTMVNWKNNAAYHGLTKSMHDGSELTVLSINQLSQNAASRYYFPYDAYAYFRNASASNFGADNTFGNADDVEVPKQKDGYILISAGKDRVYGTDDDITNLGAIGQ